jgi:hypothetical protein
VLCDLSQGCALEVEIKSERDYLWIETVLEKALIRYGTLAAGATFEDGFLSLACFAVAPLQEINRVAEAAMLER